MPESGPDALDRRPRVHISYKVNKGGAKVVKELPFVMGVMADLTGKPDPSQPLDPLKQREFREIDVDNFDQVMRAARPRVAFRVPNTLTEQGGNLSVELTFESMDDWSPEAIALKVKPLERLLQAYEELDEMLTLMDGNDDAEALISDLIQDQDLLEQLRAAAASRATSAQSAQEDDHEDVEEKNDG